MMEKKRTFRPPQWFESCHESGPSHPATSREWTGSGVFLAIGHDERENAAAVLAVAIERPDSAHSSDEVSRYLNKVVCELIARFESRFGKVKAPVLAKIVGMPSLCNHLVISLKAKQLRIDKVIERTDPFEIQFSTQNGRIRLSKAPQEQETLGKAGPLQVPSFEPKAGKKIKVMIIEDSLTVQKLLFEWISQDEEFEIVGVAQRASEVLTLLKSGIRPDVATLDLNLPEKNGLELLREVLNPEKIKAVIFSELSMEDGPTVLSALEEGAVDYIQKPTLSEMSQAREALLERLKAAATAHIQTSPSASDFRAKSPHTPTERVRKKFGILSKKQVQVDETNPVRNVVAIGASTGGTEAIRRILAALPGSIPPILIVQHIPAGFSKAFAERLNASLPFAVREAKDGDLVEPGLALIAPGGFQMSVESKRNQLFVRISDAPAVNRHKPSVDYLFDSIAKLQNWNCLGLLLTGMGNDGAKGLLALRESGAYTAAQDELSCVVFGMPKEAIRLNAVDRVASLEAMPGLILQWEAGGTQKPRKTAA
jgi:two-component system chemotaxis response regulator CheB